MGAVLCLQKTQIHITWPNSCGKASNHRNDDIHSLTFNINAVPSSWWWKQKHEHFEMKLSVTQFHGAIGAKS